MWCYGVIGRCGRHRQRWVLAVGRQRQRQREGAVDTPWSSLNGGGGHLCQGCGHGHVIFVIVVVVVVGGGSGGGGGDAVLRVRDSN